MLSPWDPEPADVSISATTRCEPCSEFEECWIEKEQSFLASAFLDHSYVLVIHNWWVLTKLE